MGRISEWLWLVKVRTKRAWRCFFRPTYENYFIFNAEGNYEFLAKYKSFVFLFDKMGEDMYTVELRVKMGDFMWSDTMNRIEEPELGWACGELMEYALKADFKY